MAALIKALESAIENLFSIRQSAFNPNFKIFAEIQVVFDFGTPPNFFSKLECLGNLWV